MRVASCCFRQLVLAFIVSAGSSLSGCIGMGADPPIEPAPFTPEAALRLRNEPEFRLIASPAPPFLLAEGRDRDHPPHPRSLTGALLAGSASALAANRSYRTAAQRAQALGLPQRVKDPTTQLRDDLYTFIWERLGMPTVTVLRSREATRLPKDNGVAIVVTIQEWGLYEVGEISPSYRYQLKFLAQAQLLNAGVHLWTGTCSKESVEGSQYDWMDIGETTLEKVLADLVGECTKDIQRQFPL